MPPDYEQQQHLGQSALTLPAGEMDRPDQQGTDLILLRNLMDYSEIKSHVMVDEPVHKFTVWLWTEDVHREENFLDGDKFIVGFFTA